MNLSLSQSVEPSKCVYSWLGVLHYLMHPCLIVRPLLSGVRDKQKPRCLPLLVAQTLRLLSSRDYIDEVHYLTYRCDHFLLSSPLLRLHYLTCLYYNSPILGILHSNFMEYWQGQTNSYCPYTPSHIITDMTAFLEELILTPSLF